MAAHRHFFGSFDYCAPLLPQDALLQRLRARPRLPACRRPSPIWADPLPPPDARLPLFLAVTEEQWFQQECLAQHWHAERRLADWRMHQHRNHAPLQLARPVEARSRSAYLTPAPLPPLLTLQHPRLQHPAILLPLASLRRLGDAQRRRLRVLRTRGLHVLALPPKGRLDYVARAWVMYLLGRWLFPPITVANGTSGLPWLRRGRNLQLRVRQLLREQLPATPPAPPELDALMRRADPAAADWQSLTATLADKGSLVFPADELLRGICSRPLEHGGLLAPRRLESWINLDMVHQGAWPTLDPALDAREPHELPRRGAALEHGQHLVILPDWAHALHALPRAAQCLRQRSARKLSPPEVQGALRLHGCDAAATVGAADARARLLQLLDESERPEAARQQRRAQERVRRELAAERWPGAHQLFHGCRRGHALPVFFVAERAFDDPLLLPFNCVALLPPLPRPACYELQTASVRLLWRCLEAHRARGMLLVATDKFTRALWKSLPALLGAKPQMELMDLRALKLRLARRDFACAPLLEEIAPLWGKRPAA
jgi:hypothetical protein